ncbi:MAG: undecaprenyldiphospho-muramoylpentapeptide beta-N-acetylglucosaminyltransferase [Bacteroidales bacterium]|jgi:UDP-N-acetylglucosamine--N-acetylmuramyl-(pentapeptide) pyrophosphoryl-undecaprenol N-acetylglucosamine transferase|nr:undecaprenyldiphospho-muramoylpentapeptide beta-N-acetylglucosaminyltransferase [Bacteroidales bacterium]
MRKIKVIISGGGTGGHIFPALSIANAIKRERPDTEFLFVGASGRMEMERVPEAGYEIRGIPAKGLKRPLYSLSNISVALDYIKCKSMARKILREFKPDVAVGVGGYASAAIVNRAAAMKIPVLLQEQNSYAGLVNRKNGKHADIICVAYEGMERFFPKDKILMTGNPIRREIKQCTSQMKKEGLDFYKLDGNRPVILFVGGSLGCRTLNDCMMNEINKKGLFGNGNGSEGICQALWQCGKFYKKEVDSFMSDKDMPDVRYSDFIKRMDLAYAAADIVVCRAGAGTISELCVAGKCTVFVPSPVVAEDHQTHNAMALTGKNAAMMIKDSEAVEKLMPILRDLISKPEEIAKFERNILELAKKDAAERIASECIRLAEKK